MSLAWLKLDIVLGSIGKLAAAGLLLTTLGLSGCGDDPVKAGVAKGCTLNSDCNGGLVCSFGLCHQECEITTDCPAGQRCVKTDDSNVCQLDDEAACHFKSDCQEPLVCAIDLQCRNQCQADLDCLKGQKCADGVCAEPAEVTEEGGLKGAVGVGGEGGGGPGPTSGGSTGNGGTTGNGGNSGTTGSGMGGDDTGGMSQGGMPTVEPCVPGGECAVEGEPCQAGTIVCDAADKPACMSLGDAEDGVECGTNKVCSSGSCVACKVGDDCQPDADNVCLAGTVSCANGPSCDPAGNAAAGTDCGTDKVCSSGNCVACKVGDACDPTGLPCKTGTLACAAGPVCQATGNKDGGTSCGTDQVCTSNGSCASCVQGGVCTPDDECHQGQQDCTSGPNCIDTQLAGNEGSSCGSVGYNFCTAGSCVACQNGSSCVPTNPCHKGTLNCNTTPPTCNDSNANATDGISCGTDKSCISGACLTNDRTLTITSGAVADVAIDAPFAAVTAHLVDKDDKAVVGAQLTVTASAGAYAVAGAATNASGNAQISGRVGRAVDTYTFTVSAPGATPTQFTVKSVVPNDKNIFTLVNINHPLSGLSTVPGPGTISKLYGEARAVVAATDGTLYIASYYAVFKLTPAGVLTRFAGDVNEAAGYTGDSGPATSARLNGVVSLALDEPNKLLYIADYSNSAVRVVDLTTNVISTYAGGNPVGSAPYGDNNPASQAYTSPTSVDVAPNGDLYISDYYYTNRIRRVDYSDGNIYAFLSPGGGCTQAGPLTFTGCGDYNDACSLAWDKDGKTFIAGKFCGGGLQGTTNAIARADVDPQTKTVTGLTLIAGTYTASVSEGGVATSASFAVTPSIAFDKAGNLFVASRNEQRIRRIDSLTQHITTVAGDGTAGYLGDYVAATGSQVNNPRSLSFDGANNLYFADATNLAIRSLWNIGATSALTGSLATTAGTGQTVNVDSTFASLQVKLTDSNNATINGVGVQWRRLDTGSGLSGGGLASTTIKTSSVGGSAGTSSITGRVGLAISDYKFEASYSDIHGNAVTGSPQTFTVKAKAPTANTIFPVINLSYTNAVGGVPGPAVFATMNSYGLGVAAASDGTIYASDNCAVYKVTARGEISLLAGTPGSCGLSGDSGPAANAKLSGAYGLALDEPNGVLYVADYYNRRVRVVTLTDNPPQINTFAGGNTINTAPYGVPGGGGTATDADIGNPSAVSVDSAGLVYIPDYSHNRILVADPSVGTISVWLAGNTTCVAGTVQLHSVKQFETAVRFKANGDAYVSGYLCQGTNTSYTTGIMLKPAAGAVTRIAGLSPGASTENIDATGATIPALSDFVIEADGNIVLATYTDNHLRRIDMTSGKIQTIAGTGVLPTAGQDAGSYVDASAAQFYYPWRLATTPGNHILIGDEYTYSTRMIW